jgi:hypothetical protein
MKPITDLQVVQAFQNAERRRASWLDGTGGPGGFYPYDWLEDTGHTFDSCYVAMERALEKGLVGYVLSLRCGHLTEKGEALLAAGGAQ